MLWVAAIAAVLLLAMVSGPRRPKARPQMVAPPAARTEPQLFAAPARSEVEPEIIPKAMPMPREQRPAGKPAPIQMLAGDHSYSFEIVGESRHQDVLEELADGRSLDGVEVLRLAHLVQEPANPLDRNAVRVEIDGKAVGYLSRQHAAEYSAVLSGRGLAGRVFACRARIRGGWDRGPDDRGFFGVDLDLDWPPHAAS